MAKYFISSTGSDSAAGTSRSSPWRTLQKAANTMSAGDDVTVLAGNYPGFNMTRSGTAAGRITFTGEAGATVNSKPSSQSSGTGFMNLEGANYITIEGFTVDPGTANYGTCNSGIRSVTNRGVIIRKNTIRNASWWGILGGFNTDMLIEGNDIADTKIQHGIYVGNSPKNVTIRGNKSVNNRQCGIQINADKSQGGDGIASGIVVENNVLRANGVGGGASMNFDGVSNSIIRNNDIFSEWRIGMAFYRIDGVKSELNEVCGNTVVMPTGYYAIQIINGSTGFKVHDNIFYRPAGTAYGSICIDSSSRPGFVSDYNVVVDRFIFDDSPINFAQWKALGYDAHSFISTPAQLFVNEAAKDYRLKAGSPAIDKGIPLAQLTTDITGGTRTGSPDIGAYEFSTSPPVPPIPPIPPPTPTLTANAGQDATIDEGQPVTVTGTAAGGTPPYGYSWNFGDGPPFGTGQSATHNYVDSGAYTVTMTVTDGAGAVAVDTSTVTVRNVAPTAVLVNSGPVNAGESVMIEFRNQADPADTAFTYSYDLNGDGIFEIRDVSTPSMTTSYGSPGTYLVRGQIADKDGGKTTYSTPVVVTEPPVPPLTGITQTLNYAWANGGIVNDTAVVTGTATRTS